MSDAQLTALQCIAIGIASIPAAGLLCDRLRNRTTHTTNQENTRHEHH